MWEPSEPMKAWHLAMQEQAEHEAICPPCLLNGVPMCREGARLQRAARTAHEALISDQYAGKAVA